MIKYIHCILLLNIICSAYSKEMNFTIIHTNDLHSYIGGLGPDALFTETANDKDPVLGHYSRLTHLIKKKKIELSKKNEPFILIDAGDFYAGTLFQVLGPDKEIPAVPELEFFLFNDYDFTTVGNHEFDAKDIGFYNMLKKVDKDKKDFKILSSNFVFENKISVLKEFYKKFEGEKHNHLITDIYTKEITQNDKKLKLGFIGILGPDGAKVSTANRKDISFIGHNDKKVKHNFDELYALLRKKIQDLKEKYKVDIIVLTMHGGTPEDSMIAENVDGIDIIIAGHTHELYEKPKMINNTIITQVQCYGNYLGVLSLNYQEGKVKLQNDLPTYTLVDDSIPSDPEYDKLVTKYISFINQKIKKYDYQYNTPILKLKKDYLRKDFESHNKLGLIVASAIKNQFNKEKAKTAPPVDLFFTTMGLIRSDLITDKANIPTPLQFSDIYKFLPLGNSKDGETGFPIVTFYLQKSQVKTLINFLEIYKNFSGNYTPVFSDSLNYRINAWGIPGLNRVKDLTLNGKPYDQWPEYIHVSTSSYIAGHIDQVGPMSYGLVSFSPLDKMGKKINAPYVTSFKEFKLLSDYLKENPIIE